MALIVEDPDAPSVVGDHWIAHDIPPVTELPGGMDALGSAGANSSGNMGYDGPCPPNGIHRYHFRLYALDTSLGLSEGADKRQLLDALSGHVLAEATLAGRFGR